MPATETGRCLPWNRCRGHLPTWRQVRAHLAGRSLLAATSVAVALGVVMIVLKDVVLIHLH